MAHVTTPLPPLPERVPRPVRELVTAMLAKDPAERPASAADVAQRMEQLMDDDGVSRAETAPAVQGAGAEDDGAHVTAPTGPVASVRRRRRTPDRSRWRRPTWAELAADRRWLTAVGVGLVLIVVLALTLGTLALGGDRPTGAPGLDQPIDRQ